MCGKDELCAMRVGLFVHEETYDGTCHHRMKLRVKFVYKEHFTAKERVKDRSRECDNFVRTTLLLVVCVESNGVDSPAFSVIYVMSRQCFDDLSIIEFIVGDDG